MSVIQIAIVEDEQLVLNSLTALFGTIPDTKVMISLSSVEEFLELELRNTPDVVLLDIGLAGGMSGLEGIKLIKKKYPATEVIMLTAFEEPEKIFKALCAGATAYITKRTAFPRIVDAIRTVHHGGSYMSPSVAKIVVDHFAPKTKQTADLTARQHQIVQGVAEGLSYKMIADRLLISAETVKDHIKKIYKILAINSKAELIERKLSGKLD